jgi:hypothetical protein
VGTDEGKKLRPRIGSACWFVIHRRRRCVSRPPIELPTRDYLLLRAPYRERRDQREDENGHDHEVQFHVISPVLRRLRNKRYTLPFPMLVGSLGRWLSRCCEIAEATMAQPVTKKPRQCRGYLLLATGMLRH